MAFGEIKFDVVKRQLAAGDWPSALSCCCSMLEKSIIASNLFEAINILSVEREIGSQASFRFKGYCSNKPGKQDFEAYFDYGLNRGWIEFTD